MGNNKLNNRSRKRQLKNSKNIEKNRRNYKQFKIFNNIELNRRDTLIPTRLWPFFKMNN